MISTFTISPVTGGGSGKIFTATVSGPANTTLNLEASNDLGLSDPWATITTAPTDGAGIANFTFTDTLATGPRRFYRLGVP